MSSRHLPASTSTLRVDVRGAEIVDEASETNDIYLPKHTEFISHIALDIGGSLAKIVYFTRASDNRPRKLPSEQPVPTFHQADLSDNVGEPRDPDVQGTRKTVNGDQLNFSGQSNTGKMNGILTPALVREAVNASPNKPFSSDFASGAEGSSADELPRPPLSNAALPEHFSSTRSHPRTSSISSLPGGRLNFIKFETECIDSECIPFISNLIEVSAKSNGVPSSTMKKSVKIILTGGGAYVYFEKIKSALGGDVDVFREDEMDCLITGLNFLTEIPNEVFWLSDELVEEIVFNDSNDPAAQQNLVDTSSKTTTAINNPCSDPVDSSEKKTTDSDSFPRAVESTVRFDRKPIPQFPFMLVNIGSGVSIIKVSSFGKFERISGTSLGGGTLWGLLSLLTGAKTFDEMLDLSLKGDNSKVDMLVGDIYGGHYEKIGLKSSVIASTFGKVFKKGNSREDAPKRQFRPEDMSKSLLYAISNNIGQIAYLNAERHGLDRIYFGGCFIRGHVATISSLSYAIRFWSGGTKRAFFLRHEGYLGSIGAWLKNI